jgi:thymidine kinase
MSYTTEQLKYINYNEKNHTKLLACAGSGKTRCIIARMNRLIENKVFEFDNILMLTFSRFTRDDFMNKIDTYGGKLINKNSVKTIDKFARQVIDPDGAIDVSLLSYRLMIYLEETDPITLRIHQMLSKIKIVFIDEAQDLNEIQYKIFVALKDKLGISVNMIGDPNQNIYQFRNSSDKFLTEFVAIEFQLTRNFRSYLPIVDFSKHLRQFIENDVICTKGDNDCKPFMMFYEDEKILEQNIIELLTIAQSRGIDLSEFAILSPTRGRMQGGGRSHGLCFISNILYKAKIKFKQFYEEATDEASAEGIKYSPEKNHVNILTYMGSKGLEWNYVIIVDADACLINKKNFDADKHKYDRYLLYVACSRAVHNMYIFSRCAFKNGCYQFSTNPWFEYVPDECYHMDDKFSKIFSFPALNYKTTVDTDNRLGKMIDRLDCYDLNKLSDLFKFHHRTIRSQERIFKDDYTALEKPSAIFLSKYTEHLFQAIYNIKMKRKQTPMPEIEHILESENVVTNVSEETTTWYNQNRKNMTWDKFDKNASIPQNVKRSINYSFDRTKEFNSHIIALNGYYQDFILGQRVWIKNLYKKYIMCKNASQIREILFYLMVIKHSIDTQHYFHIKSKGQKYEHILTDFKDLFDDVESYVDETEHIFETSFVPVSRWGLASRIDIVDDDDMIWTVKCCGEISLKHTITTIVSILMHDIDLINDDFSSASNKNKTINSIDDLNVIEINANYINFLKGEEISYTYRFDPETIKNIIDILVKKLEENLTKAN